MKTYHQTRDTWLFIGFFLLAGLLNHFCRQLEAELDTFLVRLSDMIYTGLLLYWIESIRVRLLPSRAKTYIVSASVMMLVYMMLRIFRYRFVVGVMIQRYMLYAYWIPQILIPVLFLMTCMEIRKKDHLKRKWNSAFLLFPAVLAVMIVLTNDIHGFIYVPQVALSVFSGDTGTYIRGSGFYMIGAFLFLATVTGIVILVRELERMPNQGVWVLLSAAGIWFLLDCFVRPFLAGLEYPIMLYHAPEMYVFGMLGIFEICIRYRLIPYNENYSGFYKQLKIPSEITDKSFFPVYRTVNKLSADQVDLQNALKKQVEMSNDRKLYGKTIQSGYAFWEEDESRIHRIQEKLNEANETIEQENDLIKAETEQKEKDAYLRSRHRIYHEIAAELYPTQMKIEKILESIEPGSERYSAQIAEVCVLNAYVKRKTNLLLMAEENETLNLNDLFLALKESADYLTLADLHTSVVTPMEKEYPSKVIIDFYDSFEIIAEQLLGKVSSMMISWNKEELRLAAETEFLPDVERIPMAVHFMRSDNVLYMDISVKKDGEKI